MRDRGHAAQEALDRARASRAALSARIGETTAAIAAVEARLTKSVILAPYDGRVAARTADTGATLAAGQGVLTLLEEGSSRLRVGLPLWVDAAPGDRMIVIAEGQTATADLLALRPDVDPVTRTRAALFDIDGLAVPFGTVASVTVARHVEATGAWVPISALREGTPGVWTVLAVGQDLTVHAVPVEVLHAEADRVFVGGALRPDLRLIDSGPQRVTPGQVVAPVIASANKD